MDGVGGLNRMSSRSFWCKLSGWRVGRVSIFDFIGKDIQPGKKCEAVKYGNSIR